MTAAAVISLIVHFHPFCEMLLTLDLGYFFRTRISCIHSALIALFVVTLLICKHIEARQKENVSLHSFDGKSKVDFVFFSLCGV